MCGRYALYGPISRMRKQFDAFEGEFEFGDRYNIAPDQGSPSRPPPRGIPIVRADGDNRRLSLAQWWLLPHWSRERFIKYSTFNARIETVATAAAFREPLRRRRCIVPASGYFEWQVTPSGKQPWFMRHPSDDFLGFAGLWDVWRQGDEIVESCAIVVCAATASLADVHDRMPVILAPDLYADWLDPGNDDPARIMELLHANPGVSLERHRVSTAVSNVRNQGPELVAPVA